MLVHGPTCQNMMGNLETIILIDDFPVESVYILNGRNKGKGNKVYI